MPPSLGREIALDARRRHAVSSKTKLLRPVKTVRAAGLLTDGPVSVDKRDLDAGANQARFQPPIVGRFPRSQRNAQ